MLGLSTRKYAEVLQKMAETVGVSKSEVSRHFVEGSAEKLKELMERRLDAWDILVVYLDGIVFSEYHAIAAIGVDSEGCKHVLGLREGASENKVVTTALLEDLVERGLNPAAASVEPTRLLVFGPLPLCAAVLTSTDFCSSIATLLSVASPVADKQISQGKARDFTPIYPVHIRPVGPDGIGLRVFVPSRPPTSRLVCTSCSSGQEFCLQLPSHPTSRRRSCCSARGSCHQGPQRTLFFQRAPPSHFPFRFRSTVDSAMPGAQKKTGRQLAPRFESVLRD